MFTDKYSHMADSPIAPSEVCFTIVPDDSADLPQATKAIFIGTGGSIALRSVRGDMDVTFVNVASGSILDVRARAVRATGTTASDLVGLA